MESILRRKFIQGVYFGLRDARDRIQAEIDRLAKENKGVRDIIKIEKELKEIRK